MDMQFSRKAYFIYSELFFLVFIVNFFTMPIFPIVSSFLLLPIDVLKERLFHILYLSVSHSDVETDKEELEHVLRECCQVLP